VGIPHVGPVREGEPVRRDALLVEEDSNLIGGVLADDRRGDLPEDDGRFSVSSGW
jgi:hypothetical protein